MTEKDRRRIKYIRRHPAKRVTLEDFKRALYRFAAQKQRQGAEKCAP